MREGFGVFLQIMTGVARDCVGAGYKKIAGYGIVGDGMGLGGV